MPEPTTPDPTALSRLRELIAESGLSHSGFARAIGVDARTVRRWLAGNQALPESRVAWMARVRRIERTATGRTIIALDT